MTEYRLYRLHSDNRIASATDLFAPDDEAAIAEAGRMGHSGIVEIWQNKRRVARVEPARTNAAAQG